MTQTEQNTGAASAARREVYLIRHGQTDWNVEKRWQGSVNTPLNEEGQRQALLLGEYMRQQHQIDHLFSSDLSRAWDTAVTIGEICGVKPVVDVRLRETNVGIFEGYNSEELMQRYPYELTEFRSGRMDFVIPNGESMAQVQARGYAAFVELVGKTTGNVALVSHGGWIYQLLRKLFPDIDSKGVHIGNTSITTLVQRILPPENTVAFGKGSWTLESVSVTPHLDFSTNQIVGKK
jgi:broad specificity phosphatase PhoE